MVNIASIDTTGVYFKLDGSNGTIEMPPDYNWVAIPEFNGHFDGNEQTMSGLVMEYWNDYPYMDEYTYYGLFGINNGEISNLKVEADIYICDISSSYVFAGVIVGENNGKIENCTTENYIGNYGDNMIYLETFNSPMTGNRAIEAYLSGLTGYNSQTGEIIDCETTGDINYWYYQPTAFYVEDDLAGRNDGIIERNRKLIPGKPRSTAKFGKMVRIPRNQR